MLCFDYLLGSWVLFCTGGISTSCLSFTEWAKQPDKILWAGGWFLLSFNLELLNKTATVAALQIQLHFIAGQEGNGKGIECPWDRAHSWWSNVNCEGSRIGIGGHCFSPSLLHGFFYYLSISQSFFAIIPLSQSMLIWISEFLGCFNNAAINSKLDAGNGSNRTSKLDDFLQTKSAN